MKFKHKYFNELSNSELYGILQLRNAVFIVEQNCVYQDIDQEDAEALHLFLSSENSIIACLRILPPALHHPNPRIGRVAVKPSERRKGISTRMMQDAISECKTLWPDRPIHISAQEYLLDFYGSLGFVAEGETYLEDGIAHRAMNYSHGRTKSS